MADGPSSEAWLASVLRVGRPQPVRNSPSAVGELSPLKRLCHIPPDARIMTPLAALCRSIKWAACKCGCRLQSMPEEVVATPIALWGQDALSDVRRLLAAGPLSGFEFSTQPP